MFSNRNGIFRNNIIITPLEEDLQNIGLLPKPGKKKSRLLNEWMEEEEDPSMSHDEEQPAEDEMGSEDPDADQSGDAEDPDMDSDGSEDSASHSDSEDDMSADSDSDGMDDHSQYDDDQEEGDPDHVMSGGKLHSFSPLKMGENKKLDPMSRVNVLLEEVQSIVNNVNSTQRKDAMKSFAQISMISEMLSRGFNRFAKALGEQDLRGVARTYKALSEESGIVALNIKGGKSISKLDETFNGHMGVLLQGLDLYEDISAACASMTEDHDPDCDCDDCKDAKDASYSHEGDSHHPHIDIKGDNDADDSEEKEESDLY